LLVTLSARINDRREKPYEGCPVRWLDQFKPLDGADWRLIETLRCKLLGQSSDKLVQLSTREESAGNC
jgi:hypothetical protein